jgi:hypothetical protein
MRIVRTWMHCVWLLFALVACGGGGGGDGDSGGSAPLVSITPASVQMNLTYGQPNTITLRGRVRDVSALSGTLYLFVRDSVGVLSGQFNVSSGSPSTFSLTVHTMATLEPGSYSGVFEIDLCKNDSCTSRYPESPIRVPYELTVAHAPLRAVAESGTTYTAYEGATSQVRSVQVAVTATTNWTVSSTANWLVPAVSAGTGRGRFLVRTHADQAGVGQHKAAVVVEGADGQRTQVDFILEVLPNEFRITSGVPTFTMVNGTVAAPQNLTFELGGRNERQWQATSSHPWLVVSPLSGTTPSSVTLRPDPTRGTLASGTHTADLTLSVTGVTSRTIPVQLTLRQPGMSASTTAVTLGGPLGRDLAVPQSLNFKLATGDASWPWTLPVLPAWLSADRSSGTVNELGSTLAFAIIPGAAPPGSTAATVNLTAQVNGDAVALPLTVNLNVDRRRLLASRWGVGLLSAGIRSRLTGSLQILDSFGRQVAWTASSDSAWLTVTQSGTTAGAGTLDLSADPQSLPVGKLSHATIKVSAVEPGIEPTFIRVALWKDTKALTETVRLPMDVKALVADPIRPYVYVHEGRGVVDVYNVHTARLVRRLAGLGHEIGSMAVAPDGQRLYVVDGRSSTVQVIDLSTMEHKASWTAERSLNAFEPMAVVRPNGADLLLVGSRAFDDQGVERPGLQFGGAALAVSNDGRRLFTHNARTSPSTVTAYSLDSSAVAGAQLVAIRSAEATGIQGAANGKDVAISPDGTSLYLASGAPYRCLRADSRSLAFVGSLSGGSHYPNNVEVAADGKIICGAAQPAGGMQFWVHAPSGALTQTHKGVAAEGELLDGMLVVTPDSLAVAAGTNAQTLVLVPLAP